MFELAKSDKLSYQADAAREHRLAHIIYDKQHKITSTTDYFAKLLGYKDVDALQGITVFDIKCPAANLASTFHQQDIEVIATKTTQCYFNINQYTNDTIKCFHTRKIPLIERDRVIGHESNNTELPANEFKGILKTLFDYVIYLKGKGQQKNLSIQLIDRYTEHGLTQRESEIFYLTAFGKSANNISTLLRISPRTTETHLENMRYKLGVQKKAQMVELAALAHLQNKMPRSLLY